MITYHLQKKLMLSDLKQEKIVEREARLSDFSSIQEVNEINQWQKMVILRQEKAGDKKNMLSLRNLVIK